MNKVSHQIDEDSVLILLRPAAGQRSSLKVSNAEARRLAWSILADLDPDEADAAGSPLGDDMPRARGSSGERDRATYGSQKAAILDMLSHGSMSTNRIAVRLDVTGQHASVQLSTLRRQGLVRQVKRGVSGQPGIWALVREDAA